MLIKKQRKIAGTSVKSLPAARNKEDKIIL